MKYIPHIIISLFLTHFATSQSLGSLRGNITDITGEPLIGVTVKLADTNMGAITDFDGNYLIQNIPTKNYTVEVSYVGFKPITRFNVVVKSGGNPDINFELEEDISELSEVVVIANPFEKLEETPLSIQKLNREEIATYPGGNNDIAKVVQSLPGVSGSVGGFRNDIIIRGGAPNENVYYLDGIEIPNINHFSTQGSAGGPVGLLNVSFFEGVTLSTSSFGAKYDNVLSGVLQFDQRNGNNRELRSNFRLSSSEAAATIEGPLFKKDKETSNTTFIASVRRSYLQLLFQAIDLPFLPDYWDYQYKISHKINDYNDLIFTGVGSIDDFAINVPDEYDVNQQSILDQIPIIKQWTTTSGLSWRMRFKDKSGFMRTSLSTNILSNNLNQYSDNVNQTGLYLGNISQEQETKLRYEMTKFLPVWTWTAGGSTQYVDYRNETTDIVNEFNFSSDLGFVRYGVFAQGSARYLQDRLSVSIGLRTDGNTYTEKGNNLLNQLSPRGSISYQIDEKGKLRWNASVGRYYKIPPYTVLGFQNNQGIMLNKSSKYIQSDHLVSGFEYLFNESFRVTLEGFYKKYADYPVSSIEGVSLANLGGDFSVLGNEPVTSVGLGRTYGMEILLQKKLTKNFYGILAYTLYKSEYTGLSNDYLPSTWDNRNLLTFTGGYQFGNNWEVSARTRYLGATPYAPVDEDATLANYPAIIKDYSQLGTVSLNPFNQTDIRIDKKWNYQKLTLDIYFEVQNVFAQVTPAEPAYGLSRDEFGVPVNPSNLTRIQDTSSGTVLPSIGIVIDF
ncbi:MAG: TonB-dependent receptor [Cyclobacteriaceae bacterium]